MAEDATAIVRNVFGLKDVTLLVEDVDGGLFEVADPGRAKGLAEWLDRESEIRVWLQSLEART